MKNISLQLLWLDLSFVDIGRIAQWRWPLVVIVVTAATVWALGLRPTNREWMPEQTDWSALIKTMIRSPLDAKSLMPSFLSNLSLECLPSDLIWSHLTTNWANNVWSQTFGSLQMLIELQFPDAFLHHFDAFGLIHVCVAQELQSCDGSDRHQARKLTFTRYATCPLTSASGGWIQI